MNQDALSSEKAGGMGIDVLRESEYLDPCIMYLVLEHPKINSRS